MSDEIVRRLRATCKSSLLALKESMPVGGINEADEDEEDLSSEEQSLTPTPRPEEETVDDTEEMPEESPEEEEIPEEEPEAEPPAIKSEEYPNPLDNKYAVSYELGQPVVMTFANGTRTELEGIIEGYDKEGFYRVKWANGYTTNGITDMAIAEMLEDAKEKSNECVCGGTEFVTEGKKLVCDRCGRLIREGLDQLTIADKSRPKGKRMIRSEAHPISTALSSDIGESIRNAFSKNKKSLTESDSANFQRLKSELGGEFWTRMSELVDDIYNLGYEVIDYNDEYVVLAWEDDEGDEGELQIYLGGTSRTLTLDFNRTRFLAQMD